MTIQKKIASSYIVIPFSYTLVRYENTSPKYFHLSTTRRGESSATIEMGYHPEWSTCHPSSFANQEYVFPF